MPAPHIFRQGARQPLSALNRTLGGHVAGLMPHEYSKYPSQHGWQKPAGRTISVVKNTLDQQRERSRKARNQPQNGKNKKRINPFDEDETPRTARADALLPNLGRGGRSGEKSKHEMKKQKGSRNNRKRITAADVQKENIANNAHGPSSVALEAERLRQSRTPVKGEDNPNWHDDEEGAKYDENDESGFDLEVSEDNKEDSNEPNRLQNREGKTSETPPAIARAPVKTGKSTHKGGYHVATPTRLYLKRSEGKSEGPVKDTSESKSGDGLLTPAAAVRNSQRQNAERKQKMSELGIEMDEGKYDDSSVRTKGRGANMPSPSAQVSTPIRRPVTSPLRSSGKKRSQSRSFGGENAPDTQRDSPEPETARASQFVSERSPAAAMARLRRMKQERRSRSNKSGSKLKPKSPPNRDDSKRPSKHAREEVHHHHHHYFQQGVQGEYYEQHYDESGYDQYGYDQYGYDQYGFDQHGYDQHGYDQHGYDHQGYSKRQNDEYLEQEGKYSEEAKMDSGNHDSSAADGITSRILKSFEIVFSRARHGRFDEVRAALDSGMGVDTRDKYGNTLLHIACQNGNKRLLKMLLRSHADIDAVNKNGNTGLHFCFMYAYYGLGEYLISKGADDTIRNESNQTCYEVDR